jgi:hypothetical protein
MSVRVSGFMFDSRSEGGGVTAVATVFLTEPNMKPRVYLRFDAPDVQVSELSKGDHVGAACKIERLDAGAVGLDDCVLLAGNVWTAPVPRGK